MISASNNSQNILMLIPELGYGGAEKSFMKLCNLLSKHHNVKVVVFKKQYNKGNYAQSENKVAAPLIILDDSHILGKFSRWKNRWLQFRKLKKQSDITISFLTGANILNALTFTKCKTVVSMRGSRKYDPNISKFNMFLYRIFIDPIVFTLADRVVSVSEGLTSELGFLLPKKIRKKIQTIEVFVNSKDLMCASKDSIEKKIARIKQRSTIVVAGRLSPEKGFQFLIPIFAQIYKNNPESLLVIIGDGPLFDELIAICQNHSLPYGKGDYDHENRAVLFLGYRKNPLMYFRYAKIFVLSSLTEGFPNGIIEALASGVLVVSTNCPWGPRSVLCIKPQDVETPYPTHVPTPTDYGILMPQIEDEKFKNIWINELGNILKNEKIISKYVELGFERVKQLDISIVGKKWLNMINELKS